MGKSSKPVIGYKYPLLLHFGLCQGPVDRLHQMRGGERIAFQGPISGHVAAAINAPDLWGGDTAEGGIVGNIEFMPGHGDQVASGYLEAELGPGPAYRGRASVVFGGIWGSFNPYPKAASFLPERIYEGWQDGECWYPETAAVPIGAITTITIPATTEWDYTIVPGIADFSDLDNMAWPDLGDYITGQSPFGRESTSGTLVPVHPIQTAWIYNTTLYLRKVVYLSAESPLVITGYVENALLVYIDRVFADGVNIDNSQTATPSGIPYEITIPPGSFGPGFHVLEMIVLDEEDPGSTEPDLIFGDNTYFFAELQAQEVTGELYAMNPAHMLYDSISYQGMQGEPVDLIDDASFRAAAATFIGEGLGLCTTYDASQETVDAFQQRIQNLAGAALTQSRVDGKYYLHAIRGVHDLESLPILGDDNILEYKMQPSDPLQAVNQVSVEWFDPLRKEKRVTTPLQSLGAIQAAGGVIAETYRYPEIPYEALANRIAARELKQKSTPLVRHQLTTDRTPYNWRGAGYFRLQAPRRGIADMVCLVGDLDVGTKRSGTIRLVSLQDVSRMPSTTYVNPEPGVDTSPPQTPTVPDAQAVFEAGYYDLATTMPAADLDALDEDAAYIETVAIAPTAGLNYALWTGAGSEELAERGSGEWTPTGIVTADDPLDEESRTATEFILSDVDRLSLVTLGSAALWGDTPATAEMVRVDALDVDTLAITLGRGCGDTPPLKHADGQRLWFYDDWRGTDAREYATGETVHAKLLTRTSSQLLALGDAPDNTATMTGRASLPYPPGKLRIDGDAYPDTVADSFVVTWAHRDRIAQADQLVDADAASVGPEPRVRYGLRALRADTNAVLVSRTDLAGPTATVNLAYTGDVILEAWAIGDAGPSRMRTTAEFAYSSAASSSTIDGVTYTPTGGVIIDGGKPGEEDEPDTGGEETDPPEEGGGGSPGGGDTLPTLDINEANVVNVDTYGAVGNGVTDDSAAIQAAIVAVAGMSGGGVAVGTAGKTYLIDPETRDCNSDDGDRCGVEMYPKTALRLPKVKLKVTNDDFRHGIYAYETHDFEISIGDVLGYRDDPAWVNPPSGAPVADRKEHQHNIAIYGCTDFIVRNTTTRKAAADGLSIGRRFAATCSIDGYVSNVISTDNRRQGLSIGRSTNIHVWDSKFLRTKGTAPQAGIDVEPDSPATQQSTGTDIRRCTMSDNQGPGLQLYKSANSVSVVDSIIEKNKASVGGLYAIDADDMVASGNTIRFNVGWGIQLAGTCTNADIDDNVVASNRDATPDLTPTLATVTGVSALTAEQMKLASTVTGETIGTNQWGPT